MKWNVYLSSDVLIEDSPRPIMSGANSAPVFKEYITACRGGEHF